MAGRAAADLCRKHGIGDQTLYNWKAECRGRKPSEASRLTGLEEESRRLQKLLAEAVMATSVLRELLRKNRLGLKRTAAGRRLPAMIVGDIC